ncbi:uncharacterized protein TRIADDRAFT_56037 [Trichoplax adhaerens]|uniref:Phospholipid scramblase n=1 Tax=Trichoplax adhaerens TaxID=10228 RepID=B3RTT2_TRIAD|nr:hypothetical protein TRIADDRAFT_56037 [Trichoplax adhaerens]EDV26191.1 hypothetical protein TRIADDRAFT_56037 [Trichoplax adhaerens]|eukprot:XP_002112224.1 hypothetical protein TRIADDRAFT_56037 [Trichoplax adhaerens]
MAEMDSIPTSHELSYGSENTLENSSAAQSTKNRQRPPKFQIDGESSTAIETNQNSRDIDISADEHRSENNSAFSQNSVPATQLGSAQPVIIQQGAIAQSFLVQKQNRPLLVIPQSPGVSQSNLNQSQYHGQIGQESQQTSNYLQCLANQPPQGGNNQQLVMQQAVDPEISQTQGGNNQQPVMQRAVDPAISQISNQNYDSTQPSSMHEPSIISQANATLQPPNDSGYAGTNTQQSSYPYPPILNQQSVNVSEQIQLPNEWMPFPETPIHCLSGFEYLVYLDQILIRQQLGEVGDTADMYNVLNKQGQLIYIAVAERQPRRSNNSGRPISITLRDGSEKEIIHIKKAPLPHCVCRKDPIQQQLTIQVPSSGAIAYVRRTGMGPSYDVLDGTGNKLIRIRGPLGICSCITGPKLYDFQIICHENNGVIGNMKKSWSGSQRLPSEDFIEINVERLLIVIKLFLIFVIESPSSKESGR